MTLRAALPRAAEHALKELPPDIEVAWYTDGSDCPRAVLGADVLWLEMWRTSEIEAALRAADRLRLVFYRGAGVDSFPLGMFRERKLLLVNGRGLQATPIAEYVVMAVLAAAKGFPALVQAQARAEWLSPAPEAVELAGSRALVIGYGHIGRAVAGRLRSFDVDVTGVRRVPDGEPNVIGPDAWRERLGAFDWIVLCAPLTDGTRHSIGPAELSSMKSSAWVFNVARGSVIDHVALEEALRHGSVGGAYLDLTNPEPLPADSPLWRMPNVIITPHSSYTSPRLWDRAAALFLNNLDRYRFGRPLDNLVDLDAGY